MVLFGRKIMNNHTLKYWHSEHKQKWKCTSVEKIPKEAKYESVLYVKYRAEDIQVSGEDQEYWGPFYLDIDVNGEDKEMAIAIALADMREIFMYFQREFGITEKDVRIYASGGKGFHMELNPYLYMDGKFKKALPIRYRALAARIKQDIGMHLNIDMGVYSQGLGRQWRRVNVKRENGNYKVFLPSLDGLTAAKINMLTTSIGHEVPEFKKGEANSLLHSWFSSTKKLADLIVTTEPVPDSIILDTETPECIKKLSSNIGVKHNVNSNLLAMQAISYGIARGWDIDQILSYNNKFIGEYKSSQYRSPAAFEDHFRGLYDYARERADKFKFGCKMMLSCVGDIDCNSCAIKIGEAKESYESIYVKDGGYYYIHDNPDIPHKKLTNYTIRWDYAITKENGEAINIYTLINAMETKVYEAKSDVFDNKNNISKMTGMYQAYFGGDKEAPMLKLAIAHLNNPRKMNEVTYTGLVWEDKEWHFATKEGSMSLNGTVDLIKTTVGISLANDTRLNFDGVEPLSHEISQIIYNMMHINTPINAMPMMSWFFNSFFNPHAQFMNETSPSLFVTGLHGSGKTLSMIQFHRLFAPNKPAFPSISATTAFSMNKYASGTNLMPLIFDEFKPSANAGKNNEEGQISQAIRSSYNKAFESRGTSSREVDQTPFYAPLAVIGEQQLNEGAIMDRIILIQMDRSSHDVKNTEALETLKTLPVEKVGAQFLEYVMRVTPKEYFEVVMRHDKILETDFKNTFDSRPRRNIANLLTAMDFLQQYILLYTGDERLVEELQSRMDLYVQSFKSEAHEIHNEIRHMDDISQVINQFNDLADLMDSSLGDLVLMPNRHYKVVKGILYIDIFACYKFVSVYTKKYGIKLYLTDRASFIAQLGHKEYVDAKPAKRDIIISDRVRVTVGINIAKASEENIVLDNFKGAVE